MRRVVTVAGRRFHVELKKDEDGGYTVRCVEERGAISHGENVKEALENIKDALALILEEKQRIVWDSKHGCWVWVAADNPKLKRLIKTSIRVR